MSEDTEKGENGGAKTALEGSERSWVGAGVAERLKSREEGGEELHDLELSV